MARTRYSQIFDALRGKGIFLGDSEYQKLTESANAKPSADDDDDSLFDATFMENLKGGQGDNQITTKIISKIKTYSENKKTRYREYDILGKDAIVGQAIEMMADDATQFDVNRERTVWVESSNKEYEKSFNEFLKIFVEPYVDTIAANILKKGEFAFKVVDIAEDKENKRAGYGFGLIPVREVYKLNHIIMQDQTHWFLWTEDIKKMNSTNKGVPIKDDKSFVHFINYSIDYSHEIDLSVRRGSQQVKDAEDVKVYVLNGESILTERVLSTFRTLTILENGIVASRMDKSKIVRFINVEVSKIDNTKAQNIVNYVDGLVNKSETISQTSDIYDLSTAQIEPVRVVLPVKQDKGRVSIEQFENTADIKDIADIDHFINKLFSAIKVPKSYLGFEEAMPGMGTSGSFAKADIRYARSVKKVQRIIVLGVQELREIFNEKFWMVKEKSVPEDAVVKIVKVTSAEDEEYYLEIEQRLGILQNVLDQVISQDTGQIDVQKIDVMLKFYSEVVPTRSMVLFLEDLKSKMGGKQPPAPVEVA